MKSLLARALVLDAVTIPMMLGYWWLRGPHTVLHLSNCFTIGGGILIIIGFFFYGGSRVAAGDFTVQYSRSVSQMGLAERQQQDRYDQVKGYLDTVLFFIAGVISCVMGIILYTIGA
jgi:fucose permease